MGKSDSDLDATSTEKRRGPVKSISETTKLQRPATGSADTNSGILSKTITADPRLEYVASGGYLWLNHYLRSLPWYIDDISRDFGDDIYERMRLDAAVESAFNTLKASILREGLGFLPAEDQRDFKKPQSPSLGGKRPRQASDLSREIAYFCQYNLEHLARPIESILFELLDGAAYGNKVAEKVYSERATDGKFAGKMMLRTLKTKPRKSAAFVVDAYANVIGLLGLVPGQGYPPMVQGIMGDPARIPNMLPRSKFAIFTWMPKDEDPRGTSCLRCVYTPWWIKQQTIGERLKYLARFASPSVIGYVDPEAIPVQMTDISGSALYNSDGTARMVTPQQTLLDALLTFQNGTAAALSAGSKVDKFEATGEGGAFKTAIDDCDRDINKGILYQTLATGEAEHQARAASETHQDVLELPVFYGKSAIVSMIVRDILIQLVSINFGPDAIALVPTVSLGDVESHNFADMAKSVAALTTANYLDESQFDAIDTDLGLPPRVTGWMERRQQMANAVKAAKEPVKPGDDDGEGDDDAND